MMVTIFVRILAELLAAVVGMFGSLILFGIGQNREGFALILACALVVMIVRPSAAQRAEFAEFQKNRERFKT